MGSQAYFIMAEVVVERERRVLTIVYRAGHP